jgi:soluble lytic murein transglycosylase-like protein
MCFLRLTVRSGSRPVRGTSHTAPCAAPPRGLERPRWLRAVLPTLALAATVIPTSVGSTFTVPQPVRQRRAPNPVGELFAAVSRCRASLSEKERWQIADVIHKESSRYGYDPLFVLAMAQVESTCSPTARGRNGAIGLIQMMPSTARSLAKEIGMEWRGAEMLKKPVVNVRLAMRYLWKLERQFRDPVLAMAAYNMGPGRVARMARGRARSAGYVRRILARYEDLLQRRRTGRI